MVDWDSIRSSWNNFKYKRMTYTATILAEYFALKALPFRTPEVMIGPIPIYNIQSEGHASSDEILKYRSMGGIFLAHQKGGKRTYKITIRLIGPERYLYYKAFETLLKMGKEQLKGITEGLNKPNAQDYTAWENAETNKPHIREEVLRGDPQMFIYNKEKDLPSQEYAFHYTIPIISDTRIYTNMYLETFRSHRGVDLGKNAIEIDLAFRHYEAPTDYTITEDKTTKEKFEDDFMDSLNQENQGFSPEDLSAAAKDAFSDLKKEEINQYYEPEAVNTKTFFAAYRSREERMRSKWIRRGFNLAWASLKTSQEFLDLGTKELRDASLEGINLATAYSTHRLLEAAKYGGM